MLPQEQMSTYLKQYSEDYAAAISKISIYGD